VDAKKQDRYSQRNARSVNPARNDFVRNQEQLALPEL
jgi:hypothetical protein